MIHPTADVSTDARIGAGTRIWNNVQVREGAIVGNDCVLGKDVYVDRDVVVGDRVKIQNGVSLYRGVTIENNVYVGPHVSFTNDKHPRAVNADGSVKSDDDWDAEHTLVREGASIGAGAVVLPGLTIDRWAMVGAGAVVTRGVPEHAIVVGNPAAVIGYACTCGRRLKSDGDDSWRCSSCGKTFNLGTVEAGAS